MVNDILAPFLSLFFKAPSSNMYSHIYLYYELRSNKNYSEVLPVADIVRILESAEVLYKKSPVIFENIDSFPPISLSIVMTKNGNYAVNETTELVIANLLSVVCYRGNNEKIYINLLIALAKQLRWELVEESLDGDIPVYQPQVSDDF